MNKQNQNLDSAGDGLSPEKIIEIMANPEFTAEQLPGLWQQIIQLAAIARPAPLICQERWCRGLDAMYRRCETYPQHAKLAVVLSGIPYTAYMTGFDPWDKPGWLVEQAKNLVQQATSAQLLEALEYEQQNMGGWGPATADILAYITEEQLTDELVEQFPWRDELFLRPDIFRQITVLLRADMNAWIVFRGIVEVGQPVGEAVELTNAIVQKRRPPRDGT